MNLGLPEMLMIFAVALVVFGPKRLPEIGKSLGQAVRDFKKSMSPDEPDEPRAEKKEPLEPTAPAQLTASVPQSTIARGRIETEAPVEA